MTIVGRRRRWPTGCASAPGPPATSCARAARRELVVDAGAGRTAPPRRRAAARAVRRPAAWRRAASRGAVGFHLLPPLDERARRADPRARARQAFAAEAAEGFFARLGFHAEWVEDAPGPRARPDRLPARQRGGVRGRRGRGLGGRRGHRAHARPRPSARAGRVGRGDRPRSRAGRRSTASGRERREERYRAAPLLRRATLAKSSS